MTLTARLDADRRDPIVAMLRDRFSALRLNRLAIDRLALFRQDDAASRFRIIGHWSCAMEAPEAGTFQTGFPRPSRTR